MRISDWSSDVCSSDLDRQLRRRVVEDDMARRVPRTMDDIEGQVADRHRIAVVQPAVGFERLAAHPEAGTVLAQPLDPETVFPVRPLDRPAKLLREHDRMLAMVHMAVGDEDLLDRHSRLLHPILALVEAAAGIDEQSGQASWRE